MEDNEQPPAPITEMPAPQVVERPLWELSRDEQRVLISTFVGGLASIVAGVCVVGGAIALARGMRALHVPLGFLISVTVGYTFMVWGVSARRRWSGPGRRPASIVFLLMCLGLSIWLLAWIGLAAGIH